jgi:hypothetical protein
MSETETQERPKTSEPEAWRNKWRSIHDVGGCPDCPFYVPPGSTYMECCLPPFATKAEAEAAAADDIMCQIQYHGRLTDEWLGAFKDT